MLHVHFAWALRQMSTFHCRPKKKVCMFFLSLLVAHCLSFCFISKFVCMFCMAFAGLLLQCILIFFLHVFL